MTNKIEPVACVADFNEQVRQQFLDDGYLLSDPLYTHPQPVDVDPVATLNVGNRTFDLEWLKDFDYGEYSLYLAPPALQTKVAELECENANLRLSQDPMYGRYKPSH